MKIEAEKYYRTRDGRKVGPMRSVNWHLYPFDISGHESEDLGGCLWDRDGSADDGKHMDIIAEWEEPMTYKEIGTLSEIGANVGDLVQALNGTCFRVEESDLRTFMRDKYRIAKRATPDAPDPLLTDRARDLNALMAILRDANTAALDLSAYDVSRAIIDAMAKTVPHYMGANDE